MDDFLTVTEIAETLKLNAQTVRNWIDEGRLPALHIGRSVRIRREDFERLLEESRINPRQEMGGLIWDGEIPSPVVPPNASDESDDDRR